MNKPIDQVVSDAEAFWAEREHNRMHGEYALSYDEKMESALRCIRSLLDAAKELRNHLRNGNAAFEVMVEDLALLEAQLAAKDKEIEELQRKLYELKSLES